MSPRFRLSITQADAIDSGLEPDSSHVPTERRAERHKSPFELMQCWRRDGVSACAYLLMRMALDGTLAARFSRNMNKAVD